MPYYKATLDNGVSGYDVNFRYHIGINVHPSPDKISNSACGEGIHLAKTLAIAKDNVKIATEFYLAEPGVILGEDSFKVRCASCNIVRQLTNDEVTTILHKEHLKEHLKDDYRKRFSTLIETGGLCGKDWLNNHMFDVTQEDIDNQKLVVSVDNHTVTLSPRMKKKDRVYILKGVVATCH